MKRVAIFFCQNLGCNREEIFKAIDLPGEVGVKFVCIPCSAQISVGLLLKSLEDVDAIFILGCPEAICQSGEGSRRARKRVAYTQEILEELGLDKKRLAMFILEKAEDLSSIARGIRERCLSIT